MTLENSHMTYEIAKQLSQLLKSASVPSKSYVKDPRHLADILKDVTISKTD